jgi:hypothetical protein
LFDKSAVSRIKTPKKESEQNEEKTGSVTDLQASLRKKVVTGNILRVVQASARTEVSVTRVNIAVKDPF